MPDVVEQIEAALNDQQAQINALLMITQAFAGMFVFNAPNRAQVLADWRNNVRLSVDNWQSMNATAEGDEAMRKRMRLFAHDYFEALEAALSGAQRQEGDS